MKVSVYANAHSTKKIQDADIFDIYKGIKEGKVKDPVLKYRTSKLEEDKKNLVAITLSGTFPDYKRTDSDLQQHSGRICIDFDKLPNVEEVRSTLNNDPFSEAVFVSCGGEGIAVVVKIDGTRHRDIFEWLVEYYKKKYNLTADPKCVNESRFRFVSYDPDLFFNPDSKLCSPKIDKKKETAVVIEKNHNPEELEKEIEQVTTVIERNKLDITSTYKDWLNLGFSIAEAIGENGRHYFHRISQFHPKYEYADCDKQFSECLKNRASVTNKRAVTKRAFFGIAQDYGIDIGSLEKKKKYKVEKPKNFNDFAKDNEDKIKTLYSKAHELNRSGQTWTEDHVRYLGSTLGIDGDKVQYILNKVFEDHQDEFGIQEKPKITQARVYLAKNYDFQKNEVTCIKECKKKSEKTWVELNESELYVELSERGFKISKSDLDELLNTDFIKCYNPLQRYFDSLSAWEEGDPDYISKIANYVETTNQPFFIAQFKKTLVRSIACALTDYVNRIAFVLVGGTQETGKSSFLQFLCPPRLKPYYTQEKVRENDKDSRVMLSDYMFINLDELANVERMEANALKETMSVPFINVRRPYDKRSQRYPRRASFFGSTNKAQFLTDETGNTRWLCFDVVTINHDYNNYITGKKEIDIDLVWAQAYSLFKSGFAYQLTKEEAVLRDLNNKNYEISTNESDLVTMHYEICKENEGVFMLTADILVELQERTRININRTALGRAMSSLGFEKGKKTFNGKEARGYYVKKKVQSKEDDKNIF